MLYKKLFEELENNKNEEQSIKMSSYMKNKFHFLGIPKPKLNELIKPYLKDMKNKKIDWNFVFECWNKDYREAQYIAIIYLNQNIKKIENQDFNKLKKLITTKSWWETVDTLDYIVGQIVLKDQKLKKNMIEWSKSDNIWLRRVSIDFQQKYKEKTDIDILESVILNNLDCEEFFINKAIGWSLREYSKINPLWVGNFIKKYGKRMNKLSIKEASKYLINK